MSVKTIEFVLGSLGWTFVVFYSIYSFTTEANSFFEDKYDWELFDRGWHFLHRHRDKTNYEYEDLLHIYTTFWPFMMLYLILSEVVIYRFKNPVITQWFQLILSCALILHCNGWFLLVLATLQPIVYTMLYCIWPRKRTIYLCTIGALFMLEYIRYQFAIEMVLNQERVFALTVTGWIMLRCASYYLDGRKPTPRSFVNLLSYSLYWPTLLMGPFLFYNQYTKQFETKGKLVDRVYDLVASQSRLFYWLAVTHFSLHYVYLNAIQSYPEALSAFGTCSVYGLGYLMGQFFHLKYVLLYGMGTSLARFQGADVPALPRCIGRMHLYSEMWRYFDVGLYQFLVRCIYKPSIGASKSTLRKLLASSLTFVFVWMWHGFTFTIFLWSAMNFIGVTLETAAKQLYDKALRDKLKLSDAWVTHLAFICTSMLMVLSTISNFFFFAGIEVTMKFIERLGQDPLYKTFLLLGSFYCLSVLSFTIRNKPAGINWM